MPNDYCVVVVAVAVSAAAWGYLLKFIEFSFRIRRAATDTSRAIASSRFRFTNVRMSKSNERGASQSSPIFQRR